MSFASIRTLKTSSFLVPRRTDKEMFSRATSAAKEFGQTISKVVIYTLVSDQPAEFTKVDDASLQAVLAAETVSFKRLDIYFQNTHALVVERPVDGHSKLIGFQDNCHVHPQGPNGPFEAYVKFIAIVRKYFEPIDTHGHLEFLSDEEKQFFQSRDRNLEHLEKLTTGLMQDMTQLAADQQRKQLEHFQELEKKHSESMQDLTTQFLQRQKNLDGQHLERMKQVDEREVELKRIRAEIDERENRQARRDIYRELKAKLQQRNEKFELTQGTRKLRGVVTWFTAGLIALSGSALGYCFYHNVIEVKPETNWIAVGSQVGLALAFFGSATFFIRWNNWWFLQHANEEFKLKRLDLDIDRANWLVELAMEWKNITKSELTPELIDKLSRGLFVTEDGKEMDIHPLETLLSAILGKIGSINLEFPGKLTLQRSEESEKKNGKILK